MSTLRDILGSPVEYQRYEILKQELLTFSDLYSGKVVLDYGASCGLSALALIECGAKRVIGVEPDVQRVNKGNSVLRGMCLNARLLNTPDTANLPFKNGTFEVVIANAVLEHIPEPRSKYLDEIWRVVSPGGHLIINETPNKYLPIDFHTTGGLWLVPWLPSRMAHIYSVWRARFDGRRQDWDSSGWRGVGFYELAKRFPGHRLVPIHSRRRHRLLSTLGLPGQLLDPYPLWVFKKNDGTQVRELKGKDSRRSFQS